MMEILVALMIISIIMVGSLMLGRRYAIRSYWDKLFQMAQQQFLETNVYALSGVTARYLDLGVPVNQEELPEMHHLYWQVGEEGIVWYLETKQKDYKTMAVMDRELVFDQEVTFDLPYFTIRKLELYQDEETSVSGISGDAALITWTGPLAELSFHFFDNGLASSSFPAEFTMTEQPEHCVDSPDKCMLKITFENNAGIQKAMFFDLQKGIYKDFF